MNPNQQREQLGETETEHQDVKVIDDKAVIQSRVDQKLSPEEAVSQYNNQCDRAVNLAKSAEEMQNKIEDVLEEYTESQGFIHYLLEDEEQAVLPELDPESVHELHDQLSSEDLQRYFNLQQMKEQRDSISEQVPDVLDELEILHQAARTLADRHELEIERTPDEVREEISLELE